MSGDDLDKARDEIARLNDQAEKNAAAHRADRERLDEALTAETHAWATVRAMRHEMARFNDTAREWGAELGKAMRERDEARAEVERLREVVRQVHALAEKSRADWPRHTAWGALVDIHEITKVEP